MRTFGGRFWMYFAPFLIIIGVILWFPYWFTQFRAFDFDFYDTGQIGDTIGGILGPFIAILAAGLTFMAFWVQYKANEEIRNQFKHERFETKFYELLRLHQHNVSELEIDDRFHGRKSFVRMYDELRFIYAFLVEEREKWNKIKKPKIEENPRAFMELAYTVFFFGLDELRKGLKKNFTYQHKVHAPFFVVFLKALDKNRNDNKHDDGYYNLSANSTIMPSVKWRPSYKPFAGHVSKLGHYYRHLYQLVKFISANNTLGLSFEEKYEYIKTVRAQLSNHEQALIYFNSFFSFGDIWWREKNEDPKKVLKNDKGEVLSYFLDYRIIKNLPFNLTRFGPDPEKEFKNVLKERGRSEDEIEDEMKELFEWIGG